MNKADSLALEKELAARGFVRASLECVPDVWVVNTCAVTSEGMKKSRKAVRRFAASGARVVVTGCGVDFDPSAFEVDGVEAVFTNEEKHVLAERLCGEAQCGQHDVLLGPEELVRVPVKVQEGCSRYCSYCIVPYLRPAPASKTVDVVAGEVASLARRQVGEVILCGIDLGSYRDPDTGAGLDALACEVASASGGMWLRLSSIELSDVSEGLLSLMSDGRLCRHLHIPLQSGDAGVLEGMRRGYSPEVFKRRVEELKAEVPGLSITSDVMVGFPGEDEAAHRKSLALVQEIGFPRLHIFKYSRRRGTAAAGLGDPVPSQVKQSRADEMREVAAQAASRFHAACVGRIIPVLVEGAMESEPGNLFARAESFAGVIFEGEPDLIGRLVEIRVTSSSRDGVRGEIAGPATGPGGG